MGFKSKGKCCGLGWWGALGGMPVAPFTGSHNLSNFASQMVRNTKKLYHLRLKPIRRLTLADANGNREDGLFEKNHLSAIPRCAALLPLGYRFSMQTQALFVWLILR